MKRYLISSPKYTGDIDVLYDAEGRLVKLDFMGTNCSTGQITGAKARIPADVTQLADAFADTDVKIIPTDVVVTVEDFKREYPYQRNMHLLPPIWEKLSTSDRVQAVYAAIEYRRYCEREKHWYKPKIAAAWLKEKQWLNDWKKL